MWVQALTPFSHTVTLGKSSITLDKFHIITPIFLLLQLTPRATYAVLGVFCEVEGAVNKYVS